MTVDPAGRLPLLAYLLRDTATAKRIYMNDKGLANPLTVRL
jgi:hypothetical protein